MLNWLKFTFGSYYSNKTSKEGSTRSFWNVIFALFITPIIVEIAIPANKSFLIFIFKSSILMLSKKDSFNVFSKLESSFQ